jgi:hypothetical protein
MGQHQQQDPGGQKPGDGDDADEHKERSRGWFGKRQLMSNSSSSRAVARSMASRDTSGDTIHPAEGYTIDRWGALWTQPLWKVVMMAY